jgi:hypothetical protein
MEKQYLDVIKSVMKRSCFIQKGMSWYSSTPECILVFNLQKSSFSNLYYANLGVFIRAMALSDFQNFPKEALCQLRLRVPSDEDQAQNYAYWYDFEEIIDAEVRKEGILKSLNEFVLPLLTRLGSVDGIKREVETNNVLRANIGRFVKDFLQNVGQ